MICKLIDDVSLAQIHSALKELKEMKDKIISKKAESIENALINGDELFDESMEIMVEGLNSIDEDDFEEPNKVKEKNRLINLLEKRIYYER